LEPDNNKSVCNQVRDTRLNA